MYLPYSLIAERLAKHFPMEGKPVTTMLMDGVYQVASTKTGQHAISVFDRFLCIVEALNFFSAPKEQQQEQRRECKEGSEYQRPLPWILYIPLLFYCRLVRLAVCLVGLPFRKTMTAMMAVHYVQSLRRKLRYIKIQGSRMMANPGEKDSSLPWIIRMAINVFTWGPLQVMTTIARLIFGDKQYNVYSVGGQPRSKRLLKKLKAQDTNWCSTSDLLDKFAEDDDNDPANDPDFEVKSTDLATETEDEEDDEVEEGENSEPEEDLQALKENGAAAIEEHQENNQNPEGGDHQQQNNGHSEGNQHEQQQEHHHQEHHHHY